MAGRGAAALSLAEQGVNITGTMTNKVKRKEQYALYKKAKAKRKRAQHDESKRLEKELGDAAPPKQIPKTQDNTREADDTVVDAADTEVEADEKADAFEPYFAGLKDPKIMITTRPRCVLSASNRMVVLLVVHR
jgi:ribosome production factor 1